MKNFRKSILVLATTPLVGSSAIAGGFGTEGVNTAGALFNYKAFVMQGSIGYAFAQRNYSNGVGLSQNGAPAAGSTSTDVANDILLWDLEMKGKLTEEIDCLGRIHTPYRNDTDTGSTFVGRYTQSILEVDSKSVEATCSYKFNIDEKMLVRAIGGVRALWFDATRVNAVNLAGFGGFPPTDFNNTFALDNGGPGFGYRVGASFEMPDYLVRAQVFYDSEIKTSLSGTQSNLLGTVPITTGMDLPQSVTARLQAPINETTLLWGGVRWEDWSSIQSLQILGTNLGSPAPVTINTFWSDGWKVEFGGAKKINSDLTLSSTLTWNKGIGGGYTDTWTGGFGGQYDLDENWRVSAGVNLSYLTSSSEISTASNAFSTHNQANDWVLSTGVKLQYAIR